MVKTIYKKKEDIKLARRRDINVSLIREDWKQIELKIVVKKNTIIPALDEPLIPIFNFKLKEMLEEFKIDGVNAVSKYKLEE